jgi:hypothetical protein
MISKNHFVSNLKKKKKKLKFFFPVEPNQYPKINVGIERRGNQDLTRVTYVKAVADFVLNRTGVKKKKKKKNSEKIPGRFFILPRKK